MENRFKWCCGWDITLGPNQIETSHDGVCIYVPGQGQYDKQGYKFQEYEFKT